MSPALGETENLNMGSNQFAIPISISGIPSIVFCALRLSDLSLVCAQMRLHAGKYDTNGSPLIKVSVESTVLVIW